MTALYGLSAAVPQRVIPARLKLRRDHSVRVTHSVPRIEVVTVAARRRMPVAPVSGLMEQGVVVVRRKSRCGLKGDRYGSNAHEHFSRPQMDVEALSGSRWWSSPITARD
jgi:hypothetical protein